MTPQEFKAIRLKLKLTQKMLGFWVAPQIKDNSRMIRSYESGQYKVGNAVETLMLMFDKGDIPKHIKI